MALMIDLIMHKINLRTLVSHVQEDNIEACKNVKRVILEWAKANAAQRTGPSDHEGRHWNDTKLP